MFPCSTDSWPVYPQAAWSLLGCRSKSNQYQLSQGFARHKNTKRQPLGSSKCPWLHHSFSWRSLNQRSLATWIKMIWTIMFMLFFHFLSAKDKDVPDVCTKSTPKTLSFPPSINCLPCVLQHLFGPSPEHPPQPPPKAPQGPVWLAGQLHWSQVLRRRSIRWQLTRWVDRSLDAPSPGISWTFQQGEARGAVDAVEDGPPNVVIACFCTWY